MAFLVPLAITIGTAIATVTAYLLIAITAIISAVVVATAAIITYTAATIAFIFSTGITALVWMGAKIAAGITYAYWKLTIWTGNILRGMGIFMTNLVTDMQTLLQAIHFSTIMKIHNIAYIFSEDYQKMINKIYNELSAASSALGFSSQMMNLLLNDAKHIVLDVSSMMGASYDLGEVRWLSELGGFFEKSHAKFASYAMNPTAIFEDIDKWITKPYVDAKSSFQKATISILEGVVNITDKTVDQVKELREHLEQASLHLPKSIARIVHDKIDPYFKKYDDFILNEYKPVSRQLGQAIDVLGVVNRENTDKLNDLTNRILNPGELLSGVDDLSELERIRQENQIGEVSNRSSRRTGTELSSRVDTAQEGLKEIYDSIIKERVQPPYHVPEVKGLQYPPGAIPALHKSWFVGDF